MMRKPGGQALRFRRARSNRLELATALSLLARPDRLLQEIVRAEPCGTLNTLSTVNNPQMEILGWERRYRSKKRAADDFGAAPAPLLVETVESLRPGRALDLACGTGRNSLWLAEHGWRVTAVDGAPSAIRKLRDRALERHLVVETCIADLEKRQFEIAPDAWDLIAICYYLQHDLFGPAKRGVAPGGVLLAIVHIAQPGEEPAPHRLRPGRLKNYFRGWQILHYYEGASRDAAHKRPVAEIAARKP